MIEASSKPIAANSPIMVSPVPYAGYRWINELIELAAPCGASDIQFAHSLNGHISSKLFGEDPFSTIPLQWGEGSYGKEDLDSISAALVRLTTQSSSARTLVDPFFCRLLPLWTKALEELGLTASHVLILRHPWEFGQAHKVSSGSSLRDGIELWWLLVRESLSSLEETEFTLLSFDEILINPLWALQKICPGIVTSRSSEAQLEECLRLVQPALKNNNAAMLSASDRAKYHHYADVYRDILNVRGSDGCIKPSSLKSLLDGHAFAEMRVVPTPDKLLQTQLRPEAIKEFERRVDADRLISFIDSSNAYQVSRRSFHFLDAKRAIFFKGYDLSQEHYRQELEFFNSSLTSSMVGVVPVFLGSDALEYCMVLRFAQWPGSRSRIEQWPDLGSRVLRVLARDLYRRTLSTQSGREWLKCCISSLVEEDADEFGALEPFLAELEKHEIMLARVHGDFKLPNVMTGKDDTWCLVDWEATCDAPIYVDTLKGAMDFARRTNTSERVLETVPTVLKWVRIINQEVCSSAAGASSIKATLIASAFHLVRQELDWGNKASLQSNFAMLVPLLSAVLGCLEEQNVL